MAALNKRVRDYNLNCPVFAQMLFFDPVEEAISQKGKDRANMIPPSRNSGGDGHWFVLCVEVRRYIDRSTELVANASALCKCFIHLLYSDSA